MPFLKTYKPSATKIKNETTLKNGLRHAIFSPNGDTKYVGEWKNNKKSGKGLQIVKNKWVYEGDWLQGKRHGYGIFSYQDEDMIRTLIYEGEWEFDKPCGFGTHHFKDGSVYEGDWLEGKQCGKGRMWGSDHSFYDGEWVNGKKNGEGLMVYPNGNRYEGSWYNGMKYGKGCYYHLDSGQLQTGIWKDDVPSVSVINDISFRQSALFATEYPIPPNELKNWKKIFERQCTSEFHNCDVTVTLFKISLMNTKISDKVTWFSKLENQDKKRTTFIRNLNSSSF